MYVPSRHYLEETRMTTIRVLNRNLARTVLAVPRRQDSAIMVRMLVGLTENHQTMSAGAIAVHMLSADALPQT